jgi:L-aminopeptidase/D-esterase-like protein
MASTIVPIGDGHVTVAALAVVNASGSLIDPATGAPWLRVDGLRRPDRSDRGRLLDAVAATNAPPLNTTIGVVATSADLSRPEAGRLAQSAHDGLARAIRPAHSLMDGDTIFGLSTGTNRLAPAASGIVRDPRSRATQLNLVFAAAADAFAVACIDAVLSAVTIGYAVAYRDLCPSAWRG